MKEFDYVVWQEDKYHVALCINVEISSFGESEDEAVKNLKEAVELYFDDEHKELPRIEGVRLGKEKINA